VEQVEFNNIQDTKFSNYFVDIENLRKEDLTNINLLIEKYPYCQALHLLAARSAADTPYYEQSLANAAVSVPSRNVLYNFIHHPSKFKGGRFKKVVQKETSETDPLISIIDDYAPISEDVNSAGASHDEKYTHDDEVFDEITSAAVPEEPIISIHQHPVFETTEIENLSLDGEKYSETLIAGENIEEPKEQESPIQEEIEEETISAEDLAVEEIHEENDLIKESSEEKPEGEEEELETSNPAEDEAIEEEETVPAEDLAVEEIPADVTEEASEEKPESEEEEIETSNPADQEVATQIEETVPAEDLAVEEIPGDATEEISKEKVESVEEEVETSNEKEEFNDNIEGVSVEENENLEEKQPEILDDATLPYIENIEDDEENKESEDNFIPDREQEIEKQEEKVTVVSDAGNFPQVQEPVNLSRYNDERLPYTFLWWLAKTRKTYQENLRPYATFSLDTTQEIRKNENDPLEHQIAENIFHINSVSEIENKIERTSTVAFDFMKKEHQIIEKFIKEEPQIKPPPANKIDTENKAKRSSEDSNELVSETLAKVYVEQMLFHKALDVYKKLSLKYPEKSTYFASQIKYLELKVN